MLTIASEISAAERIDPAATRDLDFHLTHEALDVRPALERLGRHARPDGSL
jgi:hypothetical protein